MISKNLVFMGFCGIPHGRAALLRDRRTSPCPICPTSPIFLAFSGRPPPPSSYGIGQLLKAKAWDAWDLWDLWARKPPSHLSHKVPQVPSSSPSATDLPRQAPMGLVSCCRQRRGTHGTTVTCGTESPPSVGFKTRKSRTRHYITSTFFPPTKELPLKKKQFPSF